jgi:hypothetical protein
MTEKVEKMQLGGESVPEKKFNFEGIDGDPGNNITAAPIPVKAKVEKEEDDEEKEMEHGKMKSTVDVAFEQLKSMLADGATVDEINQAFSELGTEVEKSYVPKSQPVDMSNLAEVVKSAVESAVAPLKIQIAQLQASNTVSKSKTDVPVSRSLKLRPSDFLQKAQTADSKPVRQLSAIEKLARKTTFAPAGIHDPLAEQ